MSDIHIYLEREQPVKVITLEPTGARGPVGPQGPAGAAGPNSVTSATTSNGTANLSVATITGNGSGLTGLKVTRVFANQSAVDVAVPDFVGQLAMKIDTGNLLQSIGTIAGEWLDNFTFGDIDTRSILVDGDITANNATINGTLTADHIHGNLAGSVYAHVRAGETLAKGDPVYVSGSHGTAPNLIPIVSKADASNSAKMPAIGIMDADLANNANGHMVITGTIADLNTAAYAVNDTLYVASGGGFTATPPAANSQPVARVERSNSNNGAVIVKVNGLASSGGNGVSDANKLVRFSSAGEIPVASVGGLASGIATFLATPTSANLAAAVTDEQGSGKLQFGDIKRVVKLADETRTSTTLAADSDLVVALDANSTYRIEFYYAHTITSGAISSRCDYTGTLASGVNAGDTMGVYHGSASGRWTWATVSPPVSNLISNGSTTTPVAWLWNFVIKTANAGDFRFVWSSGTGGGGGTGTTTIKMNSYMIATKIS